MMKIAEFIVNYYYLLLLASFFMVAMHILRHKTISDKTYYIYLTAPALLGQALTGILMCHDESFARILEAVFISFIMYPHIILIVMIFLYQILSLDLAKQMKITTTDVILTILAISFYVSVPFCDYYDKLD